MPRNSTNTTWIKKKQLCEIFLFKNPDQLLQTCEAGIILFKNIHHKLKYANAWIYTTTSETLTISQEINELIIKVKNKGIIKLNQECRAYA